MNNEAKIDGDGNLVIQGASNSPITVNFPKNDSNKKSFVVQKYISTQSLTPPQYFTGRGEVLDGIADALQSHQTASLCGISGLGKSSVVLKYAEKHDELYKHIVFIRVDRLGFEANIDKTCESLGLSFTPEDNEESKAMKFCRKIEEICENLPETKRLLLIFDNVDEVERLRKFLPAHPNLHLLLTSNFERIHRLGQQVEIGNLSEDEAALLLYRNANLTHIENLEHLSDEERETIRTIVGLFGFHPLAIFIAGNYIYENQKTFAKYLARLQNSQGKILKDERGVDAYQHQNIYSAFEIAFNAICDAENKSAEEGRQISIARECMKIASVLAADNMPEEIFWETAGLINPDWQEYLADEDNRDEVYQRLSQYKLFERDGAANTFTIHRLVRLFFADRLKTERQTIEEPLAEILEEYFERFDFTNKTEVERFLLHVGSFLDYLEESFKQNQQTNGQDEVSISNDQLKLDSENESIARLCNRYAGYYQENGQYAVAEKYYEYFKKTCEGIKDIDQKLLATSYNNLALLYRTQGRYEAAKRLFIRAIGIGEKVLGENHSEMASKYNNLALLYKTQGKYEEAEPLYIRAIAIREKELGKNHPDTATSYSNLAVLYNAQGRYDEAEPLFIKAKNIREKALGENHPNTAGIYNNLAEFYRTQSKYEEAEPLYIKTIDVREKVLGKNHSDTATSYNNLALLYYSQGRYGEAEPLYIKAKDISGKVLGENHPRMATVYNNLAALYNAQGRYDEAEPLFIKAKNIDEKVLGENHPDTARSYLNLGVFYYQRSKFREGLELCEKALKIFQNTLPAGHPNIKLCEENIEINEIFSRQSRDVSNRNFIFP